MIKACKAYLASKDVAFGTTPESIKKVMKNSNVKITNEAYCTMNRVVGSVPSTTAIGYAEELEPRIREIGSSNSNS